MCIHIISSVFVLVHKVSFTNFTKYTYLVRCTLSQTESMGGYKEIEKLDSKFFKSNLSDNADKIGKTISVSCTQFYIHQLHYNIFL